MLLDNLLELVALLKKNGSTNQIKQLNNIIKFVLSHKQRCTMHHKHHKAQKTCRHCRSHHQKTMKAQ